MTTLHRITIIFKVEETDSRGLNIVSIGCDLNGMPLPASQCPATGINTRQVVGSYTNTHLSPGPNIFCVKAINSIGSSGYGCFNWTVRQTHAPLTSISAYDDAGNPVASNGVTMAKCLICFHCIPLLFKNAYAIIIMV